MSIATFILGGLQVAVLVLLAFVSLMVKNAIQSAEVRLMTQARQEFVSEPVHRRQTENTNELIRDLGRRFGSMENSFGEASARLARVEGKLNGWREG